MEPPDIPETVTMVMKISIIKKLFYRQSKTKTPKAIFPLLLLVLAMLITMGQASVPSKPESTPPDNKQARMDEIKFTEVVDGVKKWILVAQRADYLKDQDIVRITGVEVEFFRPEDGNIKIQSDAGFFNTKTREISLAGQVRLEASQYKFETSRLSYNPLDRSLNAAEAVMIQGPRLAIEGKGLKIDLEQKKLVLAEHKVTRWQLSRKLLK